MCPPVCDDRNALGEFAVWQPLRGGSHGRADRGPGRRCGGSGAQIRGGGRWRGGDGAGCRGRSGSVRRCWSSGRCSRCSGPLRTRRRRTTRTSIAQGEAALPHRVHHAATAHNLQGVPRRGPSIIGAATRRSTSRCRRAACRWRASNCKLAARIPIPASTRRPRRAGRTSGARRLRRGQRRRPAGAGRGNGHLVGDPTHGGELFRLNCSQCHNFTGRGGTLLGGAYAPNLQQRHAEQVYTAMLSRSTGHAALQRPPAHPGREAGHHRLRAGGARPGERARRAHPRRDRADHARGWSPSSWAWWCWSASRSGWDRGRERRRRAQQARSCTR